MANVPFDVYVKCPFFVDYKKISFRCESLVKSAKVEALFFENAEKKQQFIKKHCFFPDGKGCVRARVLFEKYADKS